jgi:hypothetical protein
VVIQIGNGGEGLHHENTTRALVLDRVQEFLDLELRGHATTLDLFRSRRSALRDAELPTSRKILLASFGGASKLLLTSMSFPTVNID